MRLESILANRLIILALLFSFYNVQAGGGWTLSKGSYYFKLNQSIIETNQIFNFDGSSLSINNTGVYISSLYGEFGVSNRLTGILYLPFLFHTTFDNFTIQPSGQTFDHDYYTGIGDVDVAIKYSIVHNDAIAISSTVLLGLPLGTTNGGASNLLQTGDGEFNQKFGIDISHSFYPAPLWSSLNLGFNNRNNGFSDEFHYGSEVGISIMKKHLMMLKITGVESLMNGFRNELEASNFSNDIEYFNISIETDVNLTGNLWMSFSISRPMFGRKALIGNTLALGIILDLTKS